jgi:hypothetical protein
MREEIDLEQIFAAFNQITGLPARYIRNTDPVIVGLDNMSLYQDTILPTYDFNLDGFLKSMVEKRLIDKKIKDVKDYENGIPKTWDDEDII